jgi:hypothetical protein
MIMNSSWKGHTGHAFFALMLMKWRKKGAKNAMRRGMIYV